MKLLEKKELGNGMTVSINDHSRQIAGDRYNVKVICLMTLPVKDEWLNDLPDSPSVIDRVKSRIGNQLEFQIVKERSFVDEEIKKDLVAEMVKQINETLDSYVSSSKFPEKLFMCRCDQIRKETSVPVADVIPDVDQDDEGPVDFSSCFIDE